MSASGLAQTFQRAVALHKEGRLDEAERIYRSVLKVVPDQADALHLLGVVAAQRERLDDAVKYFKRALKANPRWPEALCNLGNALRGLKRHADAITAYRKALQIDPLLSDALYNLGVALSELGRHEEALPALEQAVAARPGDVEALNLLGVALNAASRHEEALQLFNRALELEAGHRDAHSNQGVALAGLGRNEEAMASYRRALEIDPDFAKAHNNLGNALTALNRNVEAQASFARALQLKPDYAEAHANLGKPLTALGRYDEAIACFRKALALKPDLIDAHSNLIFTLDLKEGTGFREHAEECRRWYERHLRPLEAARRPHANPRDPARRLRVGYVSADFRDHSAARVFGPVIRHHDHSRFDVALYSGVAREDDMTAAFRRNADLWRSTVGMSDSALAEQIRADGVDILVDLAAFSEGNRLPAFARKPAPVQVTAWGYAVSTGLPAIDYHFSDSVAVPEEARRYYTEAIVDLPCCVAFEPPQDAPDESPVPSLQGQPLTFGCLNRLTKMSDAAVKVWSLLLTATPGARLVLKDHRLSQPAEQQRVAEVFASRGVDPARLLLLPGTSHTEHLAAYGKIDVVLDPFPHTGGISTLEALWMGVPVVTLLGNSFPARVSGAILSALGLRDWLARSQDEYLELAVRLAGDPQARAGLRGTLRSRVRASALCDGAGYCRAVEAAYRDMWVKYCAGAAQ